MEQVLGDIRAMRLRGDTGIPLQHSLEGSKIKNSQITTNNDLNEWSFLRAVFSKVIIL